MLISFGVGEWPGRGFGKRWIRFATAQIGLAALSLACGREADTGPERALVERVQITSSKAVYRVGEPIEFEIRNDSQEEIQFTMGCERPLVEMLSDGDSLLLTTETDDSVPQPTTLAPGAIRLCRWDQQAWQALSREGRERFRHFTELAPVPPGRYRLRLDFHGAGEDLGAAPRPRTVRSSVVTIQ